MSEIGVKKFTDMQRVMVFNSETKLLFRFCLLYSCLSVLPVRVF